MRPKKILVSLLVFLISVVMIQGIAEPIIEKALGLNVVQAQQSLAGSYFKVSRTSANPNSTITLKAKVKIDGQKAASALVIFNVYYIGPNHSPYDVISVPAFTSKSGTAKWRFKLQDVDPLKVKKGDQYYVSAWVVISDPSNPVQLGGYIVTAKRDEK